MAAKHLLKLQLNIASEKCQSTIDWLSAYQRHSVDLADSLLQWQTQVQTVAKHLTFTLFTMLIPHCDEPHCMGDMHAIKHALPPLQKNQLLLSVSFIVLIGQAIIIITN